MTGATATATHGTGARFRNLSAQIAALRLVTASGEAVDLSPETRRRGATSRRASRSGRSGVVSAMTIECVPLYTLRPRRRAAAAGRTLANIDEYVDGERPLRVLCFPYTDRALTRKTERVDGRRARRPPGGAGSRTT